MKQNITVAIEKSLLKKARVLAAQRETSISALLAELLRENVEGAFEYERARKGAIEMLKAPPFRLGGKRMDREEIYDRQGLR